MLRKSLLPAALIAFAAACGGADTSSSTNAVVVDKNGGRIFTASGMGRLDIPKDALQAQVEIQLVERFDAAGRHEIEIQPADVRFAKPAKLTFKMDDTVQPEREHAVEVEVQNQVEVEVEIQKQVCDVMEREIQAEINHAGRFRREDRPI